MIVKYMSVPLGYVDRLLDKTQPVFYDSETIGLYGEIVLAQFFQEEWDEALLVEYPNKERLQNLLQDAWVVCYNTSYDMSTLGISPAKIDDLFYASRTAYPLQEGHSLSETAPHFYIGIDKGDMQKSFMQVRQGFTDNQLNYGALDVYALQWIWEQDDIQTVLDDNLAYKVDIKNLGYALTFQHNGMPVIKKKWEESVEKTEAERQEYQNQLNDIVGFELNVKSWMQKQKAFPELPIDPKTGKIPTGEPAFKRLYLESESINKAAKQRMKEKGVKYIPLEYTEQERKTESYNLVMKTTKRRTQLQDLEKYRESYYPNEDPVRIRTFFNVAGAITGRYTSSGGGANGRIGYTNIQNIGRHFKGIFGYEESSSRSLVSADYGTAELIAGCSLFKVPTMRDLIMDGIDLHKAMAAEVTGKAVEDITKEERQHAKAINFGLSK